MTEPHPYTWSEPLPKELIEIHNGNTHVKYFEHDFTWKSPMGTEYRGRICPFEMVRRPGNREILGVKYEVGFEVDDSDSVIVNEGQIYRTISTFYAGVMEFYRKLNKEVVELVINLPDGRVSGDWYRRTRVYNRFFEKLSYLDEDFRIIFNGDTWTLVNKGFPYVV